MHVILSHLIAKICYENYNSSSSVSNWTWRQSVWYFLKQVFSRSYLHLCCILRYITDILCPLLGLFRLLVILRFSWWLSKCSSFSSVHWVVSTVQLSSWFVAGCCEEGVVCLWCWFKIKHKCKFEFWKFLLLKVWEKTEKDISIKNIQQKNTKFQAILTAKNKFYWE